MLNFSDKLDFLGLFSPSAQDIHGGKTETRMFGVSENIKSQDIIEFSYSAQGGTGLAVEPKLALGAFALSCKLLPNGNVHIVANGSGNIYQRDNTRFILDYEAAENGFLKELAELVRKYELAKGNGKIVHVNGLPPLGDTLDIKFASGEKIYKKSNQSRTVNAEASDAIYKAFWKFSQKNGYDFTTTGSNKPVYDDADEAYLQGTWEGRHFGKEVKAVFSGRHVQIWYDGKLTDDTDYVIVEGAVIPAKPYTADTKYAKFNAVQKFRKTNNFIMVGHVYNGASSSFELRKVKQ